MNVNIRVIIYDDCIYSHKDIEIIHNDFASSTSHTHEQIGAAMPAHGSQLSVGFVIRVKLTIEVAGKTFATLYRVVHGSNEEGNQPSVSAETSFPACCLLQWWGSI